MKNEKNIDVLIAAEQAKLDKLEQKQEEIGKKVKLCKSTISKYMLMKNNCQFSTLSNALNGKGISIEDILAAVSAGDLLSLQEKIETTENPEKKESKE